MGRQLGSARLACPLTALAVVVNMARMTDSEIDERFLRLETKIAYQEKLVAELNDVLLERGNEVDKLKLRVAFMERQVHEGEEFSLAHEPPPHY